ncbi:hypothetical protein AMTRI_Chr12g275680 [Amborella trichopoda]
MAEEVELIHLPPHSLARSAPAPAQDQREEFCCLPPTTIKTGPGPPPSWSARRVGGAGKSLYSASSMQMNNFVNGIKNGHILNFFPYMPINNQPPSSHSSPTTVPSAPGSPPPVPSLPPLGEASLPPFQTNPSFLSFPPPGSPGVSSSSSSFPATPPTLLPLPPSWSPPLHSHLASPSHSVNREVGPSLTPWPLPLLFLSFLPLELLSEGGFSPSSTVRNSSLLSMELDTSLLPFGIL